MESQEVTEKKRHGCFIAWLIWMLIAFIVFLVQAIIPIIGLFITDSSRALAEFPGWIWSALFLISLKYIFVVALIKWKKWGFWGLFLSNIGLFFVVFGIFAAENAPTGLALLLSAFVFHDWLILYVALHIGKDKKMWQKLTQ